MFIAMRYWSGSRSLTQYHHWTLTEAPLRYILLLPCVMGIPRLPVHRTSPFMLSNRSQMGQLLGWAPLRPRMWVWVVDELVGLGHHPLR